VAAGYDYSLHLNAKQGITRTAVRETILAHRLQREASTDQQQSALPGEPEGGDIIVVGRNTFKEIVRGIHEGYLLPLNYVPPTPPPPEVPKQEGDKIDEQHPPPKDPVLPAIPATQYSSLPGPLSSIPEYILTYAPSLHILGVRHTPLRIYRFLTRRYIADEICEQVVACILNQERREWTSDDEDHGKQEERYWPKIIKPDAEWREEITLDSRIQPKLFWRQPSEVQEIPDYRESLASEGELKVEELIPTEEEQARDQMLKEQIDRAKDVKSAFAVPTPWPRR
jgi:mitochondrial import inner membrane translocase subunit TIM54